MVAVSHRHELVYFPIPKNATSTVKRVFYALDTGHPYDPATNKRLGVPVHHLYRSGPDDWLKYYKAYTSIVVVRDPIKRLISAYTNRVLKENPTENRIRKLKRAKLTVEPSLDEFLTDLERYRETLKVIRKHSIPQEKYVGEIWDKLSIKLPIERLSELPDIFEKITGRHVKLPTVNKTPNPLTPHDMSKKNFDKLVKVYKKDYEMLKEFYSPDKLR